MLSKGLLRQDSWCGVMMWNRILRIAISPGNEAIDVKAKAVCLLTKVPLALSTWPKDAARK